MDVRVTTASKTSRSLAETAASVYIITRNEIRRSGATTIPQALRLAPGMEVAHTDANKAAVAIRGFNTAGSSNKLLVMIDGRVVYTALLSGVFWGHQHVLLSDIDRIEIIRGPGATMWGANAVNGVINIITRDAADTQSTQVQATAGTDPVGTHTSVRHGAELGDEAHYRIYGKYSHRGEFETQSGDAAGDDQRTSQVGGRIDWRPTLKDHITVQGDLYDGSFGQNVLEMPLLFDPVNFDIVSGVVTDRGEMQGGNLTAAWERELESGNRTSLRFYYDRFERNDLLAPHATDTWDMDFHHEVAISDQLGVLWGLGYRRVDYRFDDIPHIQLAPSSGTTHQPSAFVQGDYDLSDKVRLTLGSKFEHNEFSGFEYQPSARLLWQLSDRHSLWSAASRAVRTPALFDVQGRLDLFATTGDFPVLFSTFGNKDLNAETLTAYEAGYRSQPTDALSLDVSVFYNRYDELINFEPGMEPFFEPPNFVFPSNADNAVHGTAYGLELATEWQVIPSWRLKGGYSLVDLSLEEKAGSLDAFTAASLEASSPKHQLQLRSYADLPHNLEFDVSLFWVDKLPGNEAAFIPQVDSYLRADFHLGWRPRPDLELDLFLHNAFQGSHSEFRDTNAVHSMRPRSLSARIRWSW